MLSIDKSNNITLTRGDSMTLTVALFKNDESYTPVDGDEIRFAMSKGYETDYNYELMIEKVIPNDTLSFTLSSEQTKVPYENYNYDIQITHADGSVDTFISAKIKITGEVV